MIFRKKTNPYELAIGETERGKELARFCAEHDIRSYCEIGCNVGSTAKCVAEILPPSADMHLFDIEPNIEITRKLLETVTDRPNIHFYGNTLKLRDSYCWKLMDFVRQGQPVFDYIYIDGAHDLTIDGFAFMLVDRLLQPNGYIEFDDYDWTFGGSNIMRRYPETAKWYTQKQIDTPQIAMIVDSLVRTDPRYTEIMKDRLFQKTSA